MSTRGAKKRKTSQISLSPSDNVEDLRTDIKEYLQQLYQTQYEEHLKVIGTLDKLMKMVKKQEREIENLKNKIQAPMEPIEQPAPAPPIKLYASARQSFREECSYIS